MVRNRCIQNLQVPCMVKSPYQCLAPVGPLVLESMCVCVWICVCISEKDVIYTCRGQKEEGVSGVWYSTWPIVSDHISFFFLPLLLKDIYQTSSSSLQPLKSCLNTSEEKHSPFKHLHVYSVNNTEFIVKELVC